MRKKSLVWAVFLFLSPVVFGQGLQMRVDLPAAAGKKVFLASHYLGNIYAKDTLQLDIEGSGIFQADSLLPQGLYKIFLDEAHHFDLLLGADQQFTLKNPSFSSATMKVQGAKETAAFARYVAFLEDLRKQSAELRQEIQDASGKEKEVLRKKNAALDDQLHAYRKKIREKLPGSFLAKFVVAQEVPQLDISTLPPEVQKNDSLLQKARFEYQQDHFWDHFDYTDSRFLYTPFFKTKLETWFTKVLYQQYDSIKPPVFSFIEAVRPHPRIFQFVTSFLLNSSINSRIMGMDALFVDLAREYYLSGDAFWASEASLEKIRENVRFLENNLIGMTAPDLTLESYDGRYMNLHQITADYTLVLLYEPGCSHCSTFVPRLYNEVYLPLKDQGVEVFAIYSMDDKKAWGDFLKKHELFEWINVWDEHHVSRFKILYDGRTTPGIYVLDEDKKIVAKKLTVDQVKRLLKQALK